MKKRIIFTVILILLVLIIAVFAREFIIYNTGMLEKSAELSRDDVIQLLDKGANYKNYYFSPVQTPNATDDNIKTEYYIKDGIVVTYIDLKLIEWVNYNTGECISFANSNENTVGISNNAKKIENTQNGVDYSKIMDSSYDYKYLGKKVVDGRNVIYFELKNNDNIEQYQVDEDSGLILKTMYTTKKFGIITTHIVKSNENIKFDVVSDEQVKRPNLDNYKIVL